MVAADAALVATRVVVFAGALCVVAAMLLSAVRTFVLPRAAKTQLTWSVFVVWRRVFDAWARRRDTYEARDNVMALLAPIALLSLPVVWLAITFVCFGACYFALDPDEGVQHAFETSGSSQFTLGTDAPASLAATALSYVQASLGITLAALLITYLPSMYNAFSRREVAVQKLDVRAGTPPSAVVMLVRFHRIGSLDDLETMWRQWEDWFTEVRESHTSLWAISFFRSPNPQQSWVTAAGCVLDAAALTASTLDLGRRTPDADLCLRAGFLCLRGVADQFGIAHDDDPAPTDTIAVTREEFDDAYDRLEAAGLPVRADRDGCWQAFAGWRVNYDRVLISLASVVMAPYAAWSSDRSPRFRPRIIAPRRR